MIDYCPITQSPATVLAPWFVVPDYYEKHINISTGIDILATDIYSICDGTVVYVGVDPKSKLWVAIIQYDVDTLFCYSHLESLNVTLGEYIHNKSQIGSAFQYVTFERLQREEPDIRFPVLVNGFCYYKVDPTEYADGSVLIYSPTHYDTSQFRLD